MYRLLNVPGINTYDTLYFPDIVAQRQYFDSCVYGQPIDAYYPPLYKNKIKIIEEDLALDDFSVNYLSLDVNGKRYYYFITDISYVAECTYVLTIVMDTIQTFMFDFRKIGKVSRKSISRWRQVNNIYKINRDYIRENMSEQDFEVQQFQKFESNFVYYVFAFSELEDTSVASSVSTTAFDFGTLSYYVSNGLYYYIIPVPKNYTTINTLKFGNHTIAYNYRQDIEYLTSSSYCVYAYVISSNILDDLFDIRINGTTMEFYDKADGARFNASYPFFRYDPPSSSVLTLGAINIQSICSKFKTKLDLNTALPFTRNVYEWQDFDILYIPYLIDENYFKLEFGERLMTTTYPLHKIEDLTLNNYPAQYRFDFESGYRNYRILENDNADDIYFTISTVTTQPTVVLNTDSWLSYYANNKANYTIGIQQDLGNIIWSNFTGTANNAGSTMIKSNNLRHTSKTQMQNAVLQYKVDEEEPTNSGLISAMQFNNARNTGYQASSFSGLGKFQANVGLANTAIQFVNYSKNLEIVRENAISTPNYVSQGNNGINDLFNGTFDLLLKLSVVRDIVEVGRKIEYYGYPVNEYYIEDKINIGFSDFNIRHYYNVVEMNSLILQSYVAIGDNLKADFMNRLSVGIRMFNPDAEDNLGNKLKIGEGLKYDNVENEYT